MADLYRRSHPQRDGTYHYIKVVPDYEAAAKRFVSITDGRGYPVEALDRDAARMIVDAAMEGTDK